MKARINENTTGTKVNKKKPIKFGAIKDSAVSVFLRFNLLAAFDFEVISIFVPAACQQAPFINKEKELFAQVPSLVRTIRFQISPFFHIRNAFFWCFIPTRIKSCSSCKILSIAGPFSSTGNSIATVSGLKAFSILHRRACLHGRSKVHQWRQSYTKERHRLLLILWRLLHQNKV